MSAIRFTDMGVMCNHEGCAEMRYGSQLQLGEGMTVTAVRARLRPLGWKTGVENIIRVSEREVEYGTRLDFCPDHAKDANGTR